MCADLTLSNVRVVVVPHTRVARPVAAILGQPGHLLAGGRYGVSVLVGRVPRLDIQVPGLVFSYVLDLLVSVLNTYV